MWAEKKDEKKKKVVEKDGGGTGRGREARGWPGKKIKKPSKTGNSTKPW